MSRKYLAYREQTGTEELQCNHEEPKQYRGKEDGRPQRQHGGRQERRPPEQLGMGGSESGEGERAQGQHGSRRGDRPHGQHGSEQAANLQSIFRDEQSSRAQRHFVGGLRGKPRGQRGGGQAGRPQWYRDGQGSRAQDQFGRGRGGRPHGQWGDGYNGRPQLHGDEQDSRVQGQFGRRRGGRPYGHGARPIRPLRPRHGDRYSADRRGGIKFLSFEDLRYLANSTSEGVVQSVNSNEAGFMQAFAYPKNCSNAQILKCLITIIYKLTKSKEGDFASRILGQIFSGEGDYGYFNYQIENLLLKSMLNEDRNDDVTCLLYLIAIGLFGLERIPNTMIHSFPKETLTLAVEHLHQNGRNVRILQPMFLDLNQKFDALATPAVDRTDVLKEIDDPEPPNNFTEIVVLPQANDLKSGPHFKPFLRPNIVKGGYRCWDHYLDVQFRLLREDFIAPLRDGIQSLYDGHRTPEIRVYKHVHILAPVCLFVGVGFQISFDVQPLQRVNWEHSRRLIFGSLLCLSNDDFRDSIIFATVVKRDPENLEIGRLIVKFEGDINGFDIDPINKFTMVESTAYFEAYRHVLVGLQNASRIQDTMPFKSYLVECNMENISQPLYIRINNSAHFNLSGVLGERYNQLQISITDESAWPQSHLTNLDESQVEAIKMTLNQEVSLIQGPPGTGKTYIGLKLMQIFLQNRKIWDPQKTSPILVVCYTNHALDQFLEGICDLYAEQSPQAQPDIVRIGGRCKSEKLAKCMLFTKIQSLRSERAFPNQLHIPRQEARDDMHQSKLKFDKFEAMMRSSEEKLMPLSVLQDVIHPRHCFQLMESDHGKEIETWLYLWYSTLNDEVHYDGDIESEKEFIQQDTPEASKHNNMEDEYITVDKEAQILQQERMVEGEETEFFGSQNIPHQDKQKEFQGRKRHTPHSEWETVQKSEKQRKQKIIRGLRHNPMKKREVEAVENIWELSENKRWQLYQYWVMQYLRKQKQSLREYSDEYNRACVTYTEANQEIDCWVARRADVLGMTTTGAAKHHHILRETHPKIIIIEEAAEVFESHIMTSLSPSVQHLILIGDHKQLRPKPNHYELEKEYNFAISLFERLIDNKFPHVTLEIQHRMRPEIASVICPAIYENLSNAETVKNYEPVKGIKNNLFFINHHFPEESNRDGDKKSHSNIHEANYLVALCRYFLKQGYNRSQITLLTMYRGQLLAMKQRMKRKDFEGIRVAAVDDFQGEENDIILLSLVRSNSDGTIGFLSIENRICVSLSRAKMGFYVIGNFSMLESKMNTAWPSILSVVQRQNCFGDGLTLCCQVHHDQKVIAKVPEDFNKCPEGGCQMSCNARLPCGHRCPRLCHPTDREHKHYNCQKICKKPLVCGHICKSICHQCKGKCQPCNTLVEKSMPKCGHYMMMKCHQNPSYFSCTNQCTKLLTCGHPCQVQCYMKCTSECKVSVKKMLPCGHSIDLLCYQKPQDVKCPVQCTALLKCEHRCQGTCGRCHQGRLHIQCKSKCDRELVCGHICTFPCSAECPPCQNQCNNYCTHSICPKSCYEPCDPCMEDCDWSCEHLKCTRKCGEICNRPPCNESCRELLPCGHQCIGLCENSCPKLCRTCNKEEVSEIFFGTEDEPDARFVKLTDCGHLFEYSGLDQWMEMHGDDPNEVQLKTCPKCKTPIRKSLRYANHVKTVHRDFERIKKQQLAVNIENLKHKLLHVKQKVINCEMIKENLKSIEMKLRDNKVVPHHMNAIYNQLTVLPAIAKVYATLSHIKEPTCMFGNVEINITAIHHQVQCLQMFIMQFSLYDQQLDDIEFELRRLDCTSRLCDLCFKLQLRKSNISQTDKSRLNEIAKAVYCSGAGNNDKLSDELKESVTNCVVDFSAKYSVEGLTKAERAEIVKAIRLAKGHWFKCPNGHIYCIGECGGAMEEAKCPECGAKIGGQQHVLEADNQLAPEMDEASYAAWSEQANIANYDLQRFQFNN